ncbi:MAG: hypothetical protein P4M11_11285 [Candidatus Pacebacteria bacterium]|nr:hypothetical protein [Candidatus Paceibacterota bacterium]
MRKDATRLRHSRKSPSHLADTAERNRGGETGCPVRTAKTYFVVREWRLDVAEDKVVIKKDVPRTFLAYKGLTTTHM